MGSIKKKNGEIELWRFLVACVIVNFHSRYIFNDQVLCRGGYFGVEFFFMLTGYLMAASLTKTSGQTSSLFAESFSFIFRKIRAFFPEVLMSCMIGMVFFFVWARFNLHDTLYMLIDTLCSSVLLLEMTGLSAHSVNPVTWYLSSMVLCMGVLYSLVRRFGFSAWHFVACLLLLGSMHLQRPDAALYTIRDEFCGIYTGNIRAFCGMSFGMYVFALVKTMGQLGFSEHQKMGFRLLKWGSAIIFCGVVLHPSPHAVVPALLSIATLIGASFLVPSQNRLFNSFPVAFLGKLSLPLYLSNFFYSKRLCVLLTDYLAEWQVKTVYYVCSFTTALLIMLAAQWVRRYMAHRFGGLLLSNR